MKWDLGQFAKIKHSLAGILPPITWDLLPSLPLLCLPSSAFWIPTSDGRGWKEVLKGSRTSWFCWVPTTLATRPRSIEFPGCSGALSSGIVRIRPRAVLVALHLLIPCSTQPPHSPGTPLNCHMLCSTSWLL